jgi:hypothetical protein
MLPQLFRPTAGIPPNHKTDTPQSNCFSSRIEGAVRALKKPVAFGNGCLYINMSFLTKILHGSPNLVEKDVRL